MKNYSHFQVAGEAGYLMFHLMEIFCGELMIKYLLGNQCQKVNNYLKVMEQIGRMAN